MKVMLIDDDEDDRLLFKEAIKELDPGIECTTCCDADEGMATLLSTSTLPTFIFLDINMPRKNGFECLKEIKANPKLASIPVVVHSTSKSDLDIDRAEKEGAAFYIIKPERYDILYCALSYILQLDGPSEDELIRKHVRKFLPPQTVPR